MIHRTDSGSDTSPGAAAASPPDSFIRATTSSAVSPLRSLTTTRSPSFASFSAMARPIPLPAPVTRTARERSEVIGALLPLAKRGGPYQARPFAFSFSVRTRALTRLCGPFHHLGFARVLHVAGAQHEEPGEYSREPAAQERGEYHVLSGQHEEAAEQRPSSDRPDRAHGVDERGPRAAHPGRERLAHEEQQGRVGPDYEEEPDRVQGQHEAVRIRPEQHERVGEAGYHPAASDGQAPADTVAHEPVAEVPDV